MRNRAIISCAALLCAGIASGHKAPPTGKRPPAFEALRAEIEALKPARVAWRQIAWRSCLLDGLRESRATGKPSVLWVFIDRPTDDARC